MSHEIIKNIFITVDRRVIVCHAPGNIEPQVFQEEEYGPLTTLLREEGYERLEEEILYLFFLGVWQNDLRHGRAVNRAIEQERMDVYELWERCHRDEAFRRRFIRHLATYLEPLAVELPYSSESNL